MIEILEGYMKKFLLIVFFVPLSAMEQPPAKEGLFPEVLQGRLVPSRRSPNNNYYLSQAPCQDHFHVAIHDIQTRILLYVKKLYSPHCFKFSPLDTYFAIITGKDTNQLEIVESATGQIMRAFEITPGKFMDNVEFSGDEKLLKYLVAVNKNGAMRIHTQLFDLEKREALGCVPHEKTRFINRNLLEAALTESAVFHYNYPYDPKQITGRQGRILKRARTSEKNQLENFFKENFE